MGEIAEMMLDGTMCECCGEFIHEGEAEGFPRYCSPQCAADRGVPWVSDGSGKRARNRRKNKRRRQRMAAKNRARLEQFDPKDWQQLSPHHFRRQLDGKPLDHWPSTGKFMYEGVVYNEGIDDFLKGKANA